MSPAGGAVGVGIGYGVAQLLARFGEWETLVPSYAIVLALCVSIVIGSLWCGLGPARSHASSRWHAFQRFGDAHDGRDVARESGRGNGVAPIRTAPDSRLARARVWCQQDGVFGVRVEGSACTTIWLSFVAFHPLIRTGVANKKDDSSKRLFFQDRRDSGILLLENNDMFRSNAVTRPVARLTWMIGLAIAASGCGHDEEVTPEVELLDRTSQALGVSALEWVNGTYGAGCVTRSGAWSARISGTDAMDNTALSVVLNNTGCVLTVTELVGTDTYLATPDIALGAAYAGSASAFAIDGEALAFYGNAKLDSVAFASNFTITIPFSDDPAAASGSTSATYATVSSTGNQAQEIAAPDYSVGFGSLVLLSDVNQVVTTASGTVSLSVGAQAGESYVITATSPGSTFASIDTAYTALAGSQAAVAATIPAASFSLSGTTLPETRHVIILHAANGVKAYQVITVTFNTSSS